ncbi:versican core protein-like [Saccostrea cucullata]|uniref:versican core protein-like n=1 Tax=Saccostrea cuccullata TaxID=36930 RepID=UPI002ED4BACA
MFKFIWIVIFTNILILDGFLVIQQQATKGNNATLLCNFPVKKVHHVSWNNTKGIQAVCDDSGLCGNVTDRRYHPSIHTNHSTFHITGVDHKVDEGTWSCQINKQYASSKEVIVYSLPASFYIEKPSSLLNEITVNGMNQLELEAVAVCVYPLENNIFLKYRIRGDSAFNYFMKKNIEILSSGRQSNCLDHEFVVTARITISEIDFDGLTIYFQFQYKTTFGYVQNTRRMITAVFKDDPCKDNPCQNGATCEVKLKQFYCNCPERFKGQLCEEKVDPCDSIFCQNGAACHSDKENFKWLCNCPSGYTDKVCSTKVTSSASKKTFDPGKLILMLVFLFWYQSSDSSLLNRCKLDLRYFAL